MNKSKSDKGTIVLFSVCYVLLFLISSALVFGLEDTPFGIKPDLLLAMAVVCPLFCDRNTSIVLALVFGLLTDLSVTPPVHFSPIVFLLCAFLVPKISSVFSKNSGAEAAVSGLAFVFLRAVTGAFYLLSTYKEAKFGDIVTMCILPEFFCNIAAVIIVYYIMSALVRLFRLEYRHF